LDRIYWRWIIGATIIASCGFLYIDKGSNAALIGWIMMVGSIYPLILVAVTGRSVRAANAWEVGEKFLDHRFWVSSFIGLLFIGAAGIMIGIRTEAGANAMPELRLLHFAFVASSFVLVALIIFAFTGEKSRYHGRMAYWFVGLYFLTFCTGTILLFNRYDYEKPRAVAVSDQR
jgi:hypothetical protein